MYECDRANLYLQTQRNDFTYIVDGPIYTSECKYLVVYASQSGHVFDRVFSSIATSFLLDRSKKNGVKRDNTRKRQRLESRVSCFVFSTTSKFQSQTVFIARQRGMVSLTRPLNSSGSFQGAVFFDSSLNMDDEEYLQPVLVSQQEECFNKLETVPIVSVPLIFGIALEITGIIFVSIWPDEKNKCDTYFILLYLHCAYWIIIMIVDYLLRVRHDILRILGYLDFHQSTAMHIKTPLFISSLWNTFYLLLSVILHHSHKTNYEEYCRASEWFTPLNYILLLTTFELTIIIPVYINYIKRVMRFNRTKPPPDVMREEWSFTQNSYSGEVGYHLRGLELFQLLNKQSDLIRYLRDRNVKMSHRIMSLTSERQTSQS